MKQTRLALLLASTFLSLPAFAASVTMLQFGSFESKDEADKRLKEVKTKYAAQLSGFESSVREVKLPPDNLTVYRTQAGPLADRAAAQAICTKLAAAGDECYIVQTAMVANAAPTPTPAAASAPALATAPMLDAPANSLMASGSHTSLSDIPERDASSKAAIENLRTVPVAEASKDNVTTPVPEPLAKTQSMHEALDNAADTQATHAQAVDHAVKDAESKPSRSFWSRMNPFSDDEDLAPATSQESLGSPKEVSVKAAEVEPVHVSALKADEMPKPEPIALPAELPPVQKPVEQPVVSKPSLAETETKPLVASTAAPMASPPVIMQAQPMDLPPPPAPLRAADVPAAPKAQEKPISTGVIVPPAPMTPLAGNSASVNVEEAKRVPVTESAMPAISQAPLAPPVAAKPVVTIPSPSQMPALSATLGQKTLWAQIGPFNDGKSAMRFWTDYRMAHPDFPVVRVRVTTPYQQQLRGQSQTWLRVGPMAREQSVRNLCMSLGEKVPYQCGQVTDMGIAASSRVPGLMPGSRYQR